MTSYNSNYILNIVPLFNVADANGGASPFADQVAYINSLSNIFDPVNSILRINTIDSYNTGFINMNGIVTIAGDLFVNGISFSNFTSNIFVVSSGTYSISTGSAGFSLLSTPSINNNYIIEFNVGSSTVFGIDVSGNATFMPLYPNGFFNISSATLVAENAIVSSMSVASLVVYGSNTLRSLGSTILTDVYAQSGYFANLEVSSLAGFSPQTISTTDLNATNLYLNPSSIALYSLASDGAPGILTSYDGISWSPASNGFAVGGLTFSYSSNYGKWYAGGNNNFNSNGSIKTSEDRITWTDTSGGFLIQCTGIGWNGAHGIASGENNDPAAPAMETFDGFNWTPILPNYFATSAACVGYFGIWEVGGDGPNPLWWSTDDGATWNPATGLSPTVQRVNCVVFPDVIILAGTTGGIDTNIYYCYDGATWSPANEIFPSGIVNDIASNRLNLYVAVGVNGAGPSPIATSGDGISWIYVEGIPSNSELTSVTWTGTQFIVTGKDGPSGLGAYYTSPDGYTWTLSTIAETSMGFDIILANNKLESQFPYLTNALTSSIQGLGTAGYLSSINLADFISTPSLLSTVEGLGTFGYISTIDLSGSECIVSSLGIGLPPATLEYSLQLATDSAAKPTTNTWTIASDARIKEDIQGADLGLCLSNIQKIPLHRYTYTSSFQTQVPLHDKHRLGFIAQEVKPVYPKLVETKSGFGFPDFNWLNTDQIFYTMYGAVQKLAEQSQTQESTIRGLQGEITHLRAYGHL